jgi:predicted PurR-regulated permease PerM
MSVLSVLASQVGLILGFAALPVFVFYILKDAESISATFYASLSGWSQEQAKSIAGIINDVLGRYIRTQIILGIIVGSMALVGLEVLRIPYAPALAVWAGLTEMIPVIGPWIGGITGGIVTLATVPDKIVWVAIMYVTIQVTENSLLVPRIAGEILQIHPAFILVLIVVGGHFFGVWGIILVVPVTATLVRLYRYILRASKKEELRESIDHAPQ